MKLLQNLDWDDWLYGMWVAIATGSSGSVLAGMFVNVVVPNVTKGQFWTLLGGFFVLGAVKDFFLYINKNPAPKRKITTDTQVIVAPGMTTIDQHTVDQTTVPTAKKG
jgi:hypothetical protein